MNLKDILSCRSHDELVHAGYQAFTFGPIYIYAHLNHDVIAEYMKQHDLATSPVCELKNYNIPLFDLGPWSRRILIMELPEWARFRQWMEQLRLANPVTGEYWEVMCVDAPVIDPIALLHSTTLLYYTSLPIFTVAGRDYMIVPARSAVNVQLKSNRRFEGTEMESINMDPIDVDYRAKQMEPLRFKKIPSLASVEQAGANILKDL